MQLKNYVQQAVVNIFAAKLRSFLAVLGILVGTGAVVALMSSGQLATEKALAQIKELGTELLAVTTFQRANTSGGHAGGQETIALETWRMLPDKIPSVLEIAPYSTAYQPMSFQGKVLTGAIIGADESLARIIHIHMKTGQFVSFVESYEHFCVIGHRVAQQIQQVSLDSPLGKQLRVGNTLYTIIGVASPWKENAFFNEDINTSVIIPIGGIGLVNRDSTINNAILLLRPGTPIDSVVDEIKQTLMKEAPKLNVFVRSAKQIIASMESQGRIFTLLLAVIGGISLLVGGIGVMNVMLVAVSERKQEIGIRKAVGAKNQEIQMLFLVESVLLALLGGCCGVIAGLMTTRIIAYFSQWPFQIYWIPPLIGFGISVITGVFFGFYPARRASLLQPIDSLRASV